LCRTKTQLRLLVPGERCPARYIPAKPLEELVWRDLCEVLQHPEIIAHAIARARGGHWLPQEWQARQENLRRGRASLVQQIERLTEAYLGGIVPLAEFERRRRETESRLRALERQEQDLRADARDRHETARLADHAEEFCRRVRDGLAKADFERKRALLELLVDRVVVTDGEVEIRYAFPTGPDGERQPFCRLRTDYLDGVPRAVTLGQITPLCTGTQLPHQPVHHLPVVPPAPAAVATGPGHEIRNQRPLGIAQLVPPHRRSSPW
jgi:site-specific DNA recombinase